MEKEKNPVENLEQDLEKNLDEKSEELEALDESEETETEERETEETEESEFEKALRMKDEEIEALRDLLNILADDTETETEAEEGERETEAEGEAEAEENPVEAQQDLKTAEKIKKLKEKLAEKETSLEVDKAIIEIKRELENLRKEYDFTDDDIVKVLETAKQKNIDVATAGELIAFQKTKTKQSQEQITDDENLLDYVKNRNEVKTELSLNEAKEKLLKNLK